MTKLDYISFKTVSTILAIVERVSRELRPSLVYKKNLCGDNNFLHIQETFVVCIKNFLCSCCIHFVYHIMLSTTLHRHSYAISLKQEVQSHITNQLVHSHYLLLQGMQAIPKTLCPNSTTPSIASMNPTNH